MWVATLGIRWQSCSRKHTRHALGRTRRSVVMSVKSASINLVSVATATSELSVGVLGWMGLTKLAQAEVCENEAGSKGPDQMS